MIVAPIALAVDVATALLTYAMSKRSINVKAAFLHNVSDALASVGVIIAGTLIILYDLFVADWVVTLLIAAYVLYQGFSMIGRTIRILMGATPEDIDFDELLRAMQQVKGVEGVHHVHVWELNEHDRSLEAHIVIHEADAPTIEMIKSALKDLIRREFEINHSTLEFELSGAVSDRGDHAAAVPHH